MPWMHRHSSRCVLPRLIRAWLRQPHLGTPVRGSRQGFKDRDACADAARRSMGKFAKMYVRMYLDCMW